MNKIQFVMLYCLVFGVSFLVISDLLPHYIYTHHNVSTIILVSSFILNYGLCFFSFADIFLKNKPEFYTDLSNEQKDHQKTKKAKPKKTIGNYVTILITTIFLGSLNALGMHAIVFQVPNYLLRLPQTKCVSAEIIQRLHTSKGYTYIDVKIDDQHMDIMGRSNTSLISRENLRTLPNHTKIDLILQQGYFSSYFIVKHAPKLCSRDSVKTQDDNKKIIDFENFK